MVFVAASNDKGFGLVYDKALLC